MTSSLLQLFSIQALSDSCWIITVPNNIHSVTWMGLIMKTRGLNMRKPYINRMEPAALLQCIQDRHYICVWFQCILLLLQRNILPPMSLSYLDSMRFLKCFYILQLLLGYVASLCMFQNSETDVVNISSFFQCFLLSINGKYLNVKLLFIDRGAGIKWWNELQYLTFYVVYSITCNLRF